MDAKAVRHHYPASGRRARPNSRPAWESVVVGEGLGAGSSLVAVPVAEAGIVLDVHALATNTRATTNTTVFMACGLAGPPRGSITNAPARGRRAAMLDRLV